MQSAGAAGPPFGQIFARRGFDPSRPYYDGAKIKGGAKLAFQYLHLSDLANGLDFGADRRPGAGADGVDALADCAERQSRFGSAVEDG
ncbi:MAG: hypothetical protein ACI82H_000578, partial [Alphaproteobacteria bacterium]